MPRFILIRRFGSGVVAANAMTLSTPSSGGPNNSGLNTDNVIALAVGGVAAPFDGPIEALAVWCYMAGHTAAVNVQGAIWNESTGVVLAKSGVVSVAKGSGALGGQFWTRFALSPLIILDGDNLYYAGWFRQANQDHEYSVLASGNFSFDNQSSLGTLTAHAGTNPPYILGGPGIAIEYRSIPPHRGDESW